MIAFREARPENILDIEPAMTISDRVTGPNDPIIPIILEELDCKLDDIVFKEIHPDEKKDNIWTQIYIDTTNVVPKK